MTTLPLSYHSNPPLFSSTPIDMQSPYNYADSSYSTSPVGMDFFYCQTPVCDRFCDSPYTIPDGLPEASSFPSSFTSSPYMIPPMSDAGPIFDSSSLATSFPSSASSSSSYISHAEEVPMPTYPQEDSCPSPPSTTKPVKPFGCDDCGKSFTRFADLKRHQTSVHYPVFRNCPVEQCSRKGSNGFPRQDHLVEHLRSYHHLDVPKRRGLKRAGKGA